MAMTVPQGRPYLQPGYKALRLGQSIMPVLSSAPGTERLAACRKIFETRIGLKIRRGVGYRTLCNVPSIRILTWIRRKSKSNNLPIAIGKYYWKLIQSNIALSKLGFEGRLCQEASLTTDLSILGQEISDLVTSVTDQICF